MLSDKSINMKFQKGNKLGKGRPVGAKNKIQPDKRDLISEVVFGDGEFRKEWEQLSLHERWEIRIKLAKYVVPEPKDEAIMQQKDLPLFIDTREEAISIMQQLDLSEEQLIEQTNDETRDI